MPNATEQPDITLASTTESQAELDHATGPNWRQHFDPAKAKAEEEAKGKDKPAESSVKKDETKTAPASEPGKVASPKEDDEDKDIPPGVRKRLDRLTAKLRETERALEASTRRPEARTDGAKTEPAKAAVEADPEPQVKDFKSWDEWNAAHNRWLVRDEQRKLDVKAAEEEAKENAKATFDAHLERLEAARVDHDDFDDAIKGMPVFEFSSPSANQAFQMALVDSENSAELMYHLAHHPEDMAKFADLSPVGVQRMVGRLEARLFPESAASSSSTTSPSSAARAKPVSRTPKPTTPVRGTTTAPTALDDPTLVKDTDAWIARRQAQLSSRRH